MIFPARPTCLHNLANPRRDALGGKSFAATPPVCSAALQTGHLAGEQSGHGGFLEAGHPRVRRLAACQVSWRAASGCVAAQSARRKPTAWWLMMAVYAGRGALPRQCAARHADALRPQCSARRLRRAQRRASLAFRAGFSGGTVQLSNVTCAVSLECWPSLPSNRSALPSYNGVGTMNALMLFASLSGDRDDDGHVFFCRW
jgi:hypothetical protein